MLAVKDGIPMFEWLWELFYRRFFTLSAMVWALSEQTSGYPKRNKAHRSLTVGGPIILILLALELVGWFTR